MLRTWYILLLKTRSVSIVLLRKNWNRWEIRKVVSKQDAVKLQEANLTCSTSNEEAKVNSNQEKLINVLQSSENSFSGRLHGLRWLPIVFCPRARWFRKSRDGASFQTPRQSRARDHAVKCRQTWSPNSKFVYRKCCVDRLRFQNIFRLNRRP